MEYWQLLLQDCFEPDEPIQFTFFWFWLSHFLISTTVLILSHHQKYMACGKVVCFKTLLKQSAMVFSSNCKRWPFLLLFVVLFSLILQPHHLTETANSRKNLASSMPWDEV